MLMFNQVKLQNVIFDQNVTLLKADSLFYFLVCLMAST